MPHFARLGLIALLASALFCVAPAHAVSDAEIDAAIKRMQDWLYSQQDPKTGAWTSNQGFPGPDRQAHGETAIVTLALLASGQSPQDPRLALALRYLREATMNGTYAVAVRAHVWAALPDSYLSNLEKDAQWLIRAQKGSIWDYGPVRKSRVDHSTTQYGLLGLWELSKRGGRVPEKVWQDAVAHFVEVQGNDGGWRYSLDANRESTGSMTAAGLTVLYVAMQEIYRDRDTPPAEVQEAIRRGLAWLDKNFSGTTNPGRGVDYEYYLYGIERVALASGVKTFGGQDWFEAGARGILNREKRLGKMSSGHGGVLANTSFALMFLARGRVPVWITKLQIPNTEWNNRPNDLYFLTRYLSDLGEQELNWQTVSLDLPASQFSNAPVAYLTSGSGFQLTEAQKTNLRDYLDHGGLLLASAEGNGAAFTASVKSLAKEMYPDYKMEPLPADHPLLGALYKIDDREAATIQRVSNGARDLILLTTRDWSRPLQTDRNPGGGPVWELATNLYTLVTERGDLDNRLAQQVPAKESGSAKGQITYARARHSGDWRLEPKAWEPLATTLFNRTGLELTRTEVPLSEVGKFGGALVHLAGVGRIELSSAEKAAVKAFVSKGGTVLVETIGGRGDFSVGIEEQLRETFGTPATPLGGFESIISGDGLAGGVSAHRVLYRPYSVIQLSARTSPRLAAFSVDGRPAVIVSHEDLSLGALGVKRWGINGYQRDSARDLLTNIVLAARNAKK